ncbi:MAG: outer membrane protein assembly factor BamB [Acidiferrobacterales bacterium]
MRNRNKMPNKILILLLATIFLQACGASSNIRPPEPLIEIESESPVDVVWDESFDSSDEGKLLKLSTAILGENLFTVSSDGELTAFKLTDGDDDWSVDLDRDITAGVGVSEDKLLLGTRDGIVMALDPKNGAILWDRRLATEILSKPVASSGKVIVQTVDGTIYALDEKTGKQVWRYHKEGPPLSLRGTSTPIFIQNIVITGFATGTIVALLLETGKQIWEIPVSQPSGRNEIERLTDVDAQPIVSEFRLFVASYHGKLVAIDIRSGEQLWSRDLSIISDMAIDSKNIYVLDDEGVMYAYEKSTGATVWQQAQFVGRIPSPPAVVDGYVIVGDLEGFVHWLNVDDGRILARKQIDGPIVTQAVVRGPVAYVSSVSGDLAALKLKNDLKSKFSFSFKPKKE